MLSSNDKMGLAATASVPTGLVSDPASYKSLSASAQRGDAGALDDAARAFESLLLGQMLKQMRAATMGEGLLESNQTKLYRDLYDQQVATKLSDGDGLGIRKALMRQLGPQVASEPDRRDPASLKLPERNPSLRSIRPQLAQAARAEGGQRIGGLSEVASLSRGLKDLEVEPSGQWPPKSASDFVAYLKPYADQAAQVLGMDTSFLLAQSALETGWGKHVPRHADGNSSFNLFGIKADRSWKGDKVSVGTLEYRNGVAQRERAKFRAYASPAESFIDYVAFLKRNPRYGDALKAERGEDFVRGLQKAGYATDPKYAAKILSIRDRLMQISASLERADAPATQVSQRAVDNVSEA